MNRAKHKIWLLSGIFLVFFSMIEIAKADTLYDQQIRERDEYYQRQDWQRELNRLRDHDELRQTQFNQERRFQEQMREMELEKIRMMNTQYPYQPHTADYPKRSGKGVIYKEKNITNVEQKQTTQKIKKKQGKQSIQKKQINIEEQEIRNILK
jgi:hypothetical protein